MELLSDPEPPKDESYVVVQVNIKGGIPGYCIVYQNERTADPVHSTETAQEMADWIEEHIPIGSHVHWEIKGNRQ